jgi:hypothetical protein
LLLDEFERAKQAAETPAPAEEQAKPIEKAKDSVEVAAVS